MQRVVIAVGLLAAILVGFEVSQWRTARRHRKCGTPLPRKVALQDAGDPYWLDANPYGDEDIDYDREFELMDLDHEYAAAFEAAA